jgi:prenyltransferase beta subunit
LANAGTICLLALGYLFASVAQAQVKVSTVESSGRELVTPATQQSIDRGLAYLSTRQQTRGSFGSESRYRKNVAVASLAGMAFLSAGHTPGRGRYHQTVDQTVDFILSSAQPSGYIIQADSAGHGPMYGHGFATLFLAEAYGMSPREEVRQALKSAVQLIVNSQNREGGWRYEPDSREADISVTVCQIMALRAARNCGIAVPKSTVDQCIDYVKKCQNTDGGFRYQLNILPRSEFARSAAGLVALYSAGVYEGKEFDSGLAYLERHRPLGDMLRFESHYFYGHYYAVQAMWHAGGDHWRQWYPSIRDELLARQMPDGSWPDSMINTEYGTAMACLILQMPNNYLPIFQR